MRDLIFYPCVQVFLRIASTNSIKQLYLVLYKLLHQSITPPVIIMLTHRCEVQQNITASLWPCWCVQRHGIFFTTSVHKREKHRSTKCFSLTPRGDKVHFEATHRELSLKHPAIYNCSFDNPACFPSTCKVFSNGPNITTFETHRPHGTSK